MVIDAMDLMYSGRFDGFCPVSSDSDFTRLAARIRESGLTVVRVRGTQDAQAVRRCVRQVHLSGGTWPTRSPPPQPVPPSALRPAAVLESDTDLVNLLLYTPQGVTSFRTGAMHPTATAVATAVSIRLKA
jgi:NYN domain